MPANAKARVVQAQFSDFGWSGAVIRGIDYPLASGESTQTQAWVDRLISSISVDGKGFHENVLLQYNQLNLADAGYILAAHGREWMPWWGLGVWPDEPPPRLWRREDFTELGVGEMPRPMMHQLFQIRADSGTTSQARRLLWPSGSVLVCLTDQELTQLYATFNACFLSTIEEPSLRCFPYFFPMLKAAVFPLINGPALPPWLEGIHLYIRQSPEDGGLFVWSRIGLEGSLRDLGFGPSPQNYGVWIESR